MTTSHSGAPSGADTPFDVVDQVLQAAESASSQWAATPRPQRAAALRAVADALDAAGPELIPIARAETHLLEGRLTGELVRTTFQLRLFAEVLEEGGYLDARIDHADPDWPMGARPDVRRYLVPIGPVVVYAASNFPFAFSVAGGDTAAALAAGNAVIVKAHSGHPELSARTGEVVTAALREAGAPEGLLHVVFGRAAGLRVLTDPRIQAGSFTGSIPGGRALFDVAQQREHPIPFYSEQGSSNPTFVTRAAAERRAEEIARGFVGSFTLGAGQFCTKPGLFFVPADSAIPDLLRAAELPAGATLLNARIQEGFVHRLEEVRGSQFTEDLSVSEQGWTADPPAPTLLLTTLEDFVAHTDVLAGEVFGPSSLIITYQDEADLVGSTGVLDGQLTATIIGEDDDAVVPDLLRALTDIAGRVLWNQWPTGLSVTYAQQHGGPYPATTASGTTSVGTAAILRFLRPVAYQNLPEHLLPAELRDTATQPRRVDGVAVL